MELFFKTLIIKNPPVNIPYETNKAYKKEEVISTKDNYNKFIYTKTLTFCPRLVRFFLAIFASLAIIPICLDRKGFKQFWASVSSAQDTKVVLIAKNILNTREISQTGEGGNQQNQIDIPQGSQTNKGNETINPLSQKSQQSVALKNKTPQNQAAVEQPKAKIDHKDLSKIIAKLPTQPSERAKHISSLFIQTLNTAHSSPIDNSQTDELISTEERKKLTQMLTFEVIKKLRDSRDNDTAAPFYKIGKGHYNVVWGHPDYPHIVLKIMKKEAAEQQEQVAKNTLQTMKQIKDPWIQVPRATKIHVPVNDPASLNEPPLSVYIEERLPLALNANEHEELWARVITHYESPDCPQTFKTNLQALIQQIQHLVETIGIWDLGHKNLPEIRVDGKGACATDFENVQDLSSVNRGLEQIAKLVPISPIVDPIIKRYQEELQLQKKDDDAEKKFIITLEEKKLAVKALQEALKIYDQKGYKTGDEEVPNNVDLSALNSNEQAFAEMLLQIIHEKQNTTKNQVMTLSEKRCIQLQPGVLRKDFNGVYTHATFLKVLETLRDQNIAISWSHNNKWQKEIAVFTGSESYTSYAIYF